ncbi:flavin monoamine oxidase family protein [Streptomyces flavofungini]|uniref:flavin monoamine oxidase family protein n=1 Tax=Streptomyces flavofungini TaxID=68200 RepID=UPI0025B0E031|nr:FAD-dependent oxidoreductase [Streptomyces flavofungini]WJV44888.1 FAD-dependent oxidoreductase [Streptomyces flavofungini]
MRTRQPLPAVPEVDTAIVGAGIGGCLLAARLARHRERAGEFHPGRVALFERAHRVGGRLWSVPMGERLHADLGAMRLHSGLRQVLDVVHEAHLTGDLVPFDFGRPENPTHVRGVTLRQRHLADAARIPYDLTGGERGLSPDDLVLRAADALVPGFTALRRRHHESLERGDTERAAQSATAFRTRRDRATLQGRPLRSTTYADALRAVLGAEAVAFLHDTGGYDVAYSRENTAEQLGILFRTPPRAAYLTLRRGMQSLPLALRDRFTAAGGTLRLGHRLLRVDRAGPHHDRAASEATASGGTASGGTALRDTRRPRYRLTFALEDPEGRPTGAHAHVHAHTVVLALPPGPLLRLDGDGLPFTPRLRADLQAVEAVPAHKLFLLYRTPWWHGIGVTRGRATTDLPLRQLWYGGTCPPPGPARADGPALLLAAYPSGPATKTWEALHEPGAGPTDPGQALVERAHRLLERMHGLARLEDPLSVLRQDWNLPPHDGAWHVWRPGRDPDEIAPRVRRPLPGEAVYIVSDCWTSDPGSIEGAVAAAETVLRDHLGCGPSALGPTR